ncbi:hypothetical protein AAG570_011278, partial [Ranatra chinensis]
IHTEASQKLLNLCRTNKGVFVKVGQHIGTLEYLVPSEYVATMKTLHSQAPYSPLEDVYKVIREELRKEPTDIFSEFESEPLGAASLAQVHKAKLKDGRIVAVKVQHPYVQSSSKIDMKILQVLVQLVSWTFPDFHFQWLVDESNKNIPRELNFSEELDNTLKAKQMFQHLPWLKVPGVYNDLSTGRVLTMEYVEGGQVNDIDYMMSHNIDPFEVSDKLGELYSEMIFKQGFIHSDPHPGNILVAKSSSGQADIILLDHGLYAELSESVRAEYSGLWLSILNKDMDSMKKHSEALGAGSLYDLFVCMVSGRTWSSIKSGITTTKQDSSEKEEFQRDIPKVLPYIFKTLAIVNRELLLILKTNDLLRGIECTLQTQNRMSAYMVMSKFCVRSVYDNRIKLCTDRISKLGNYIAQQWALFKISLYYTYLSICTSSLNRKLMEIFSCL